MSIIFAVLFVKLRKKTKQQATGEMLREYEEKQSQSQRIKDDSPSIEALTSVFLALFENEITTCLPTKRPLLD